MKGRKMSEQQLYTRRGFLLTGAAVCMATVGTALVGCSGSGGAGSDASRSNETAAQETTPEPGTSESNPITVKYGEAIRVDDASLTIDSSDGFCSEFRGTDSHFSLSIDDGKVAYLVRATLSYEGKSQIDPANSMTAEVVFEGDYKFNASVDDTQKIFTSISPLETRGITFCAQVAESSMSQLRNPVLHLRINKKLEDGYKGKDSSAYYVCALS